MIKSALYQFGITLFMASGTVFGEESGFVDQLIDDEDQQSAVLFPTPKDQAEKSVAGLISEIERKLPPDASDEDKEKLAKRQANAAVALLKLNQPEKAWPLLKHSPDPRARSYLIHRMGPLGVNPMMIINRIDNEPDITVRRALLLSLGEFGTSAISLDRRKEFLPRLQEIYRTDADPGLHSAAEWLLVKWNQEDWVKQLNQKWAKGKQQVSSEWYVTGQGQTMVVIHGPVEFLMGSPPTEVGRLQSEKWGTEDYEMQHLRRIDGSFAISTTLVTSAQYGKFDERFKAQHRFSYKTVPVSPDVAVGGLTWFKAAEYCNWLSKQEGLPEDQWCFEITAKQTRLKRGCLSLNGFRLPMDDEMEYATRAEAITARYYGETVELLPKYAWFSRDFPGEWKSPVGRLKPNDFGLFDTSGYYSTWCQDRSFASYPQGTENRAKDDQEDGHVVKYSESRTMRGGFWLGGGVLNHPRHRQMRSAFHIGVVPTANGYNFGFRLARTLPRDGNNINRQNERSGR